MRWRVSLVSSDPLAMLREAQAFEDAGQAAEAVTAYRAFLAVNHGHAEVWSDCAGQLIRLDFLEEAQAACRTALKVDPHCVSAKVNLGCILLRLGQKDEGELQFRTALVLDPGRADAHLLLAECLLAKGDLPGTLRALKALDRAGGLAGRQADLNPQHADLWGRYGQALMKARKYPEAEGAFQAALRLLPDDFVTQSNLGALQMAEQHLAEAEHRFRELLLRFPQEEQAHLLLITCLCRQGKAAEVRASIGQLLELAPGSLRVHQGILGACHALCDWPACSAESLRYAAVAPDSVLPTFEQSFMALIQGNLRRGWALFEQRLKLPTELYLTPSFEQPRWQGEPFAGKTLLVWSEQGLGDTLMLLRYLPLVKARGGRVLLETQASLAPLAATTAGPDLVVPRGTPLPPFDLQASLFSLPAIFETDLDSIPGDVPYLQVPQVVPNQPAILDSLMAPKEQVRIGLVWAGNPDHPRDDERSLQPALLAPLAELPGVAWFSFQLGEGEVPPLPGLIRLGPLLSSFSDTAYALSGMDLLITVDTSMAHLAGALGVPTLVLLTHAPDFRWLLDREDSPWYPSLRLYRQPAVGDWSSVIRSLASDLNQEG